MTKIDSRIRRHVLRSSSTRRNRDDRTADRHAQSIGRHQKAGARDAGLKVRSNFREEALNRKFGRADRECCESERKDWRKNHACLPVPGAGTATFVRHRSQEKRVAFIFNK